MCPSVLQVFPGRQEEGLPTHFQAAWLLSWKSVPGTPSHFARTGKITLSKPCLNIYIISAKFYTSLLLELFSALEIQAASQALSIINS